MNYSKLPRLSFWALAIIVFGTSISAAAEPVQLTTDGRLKRDPHYIENGKAIAYVEQASPILMRIVRFDPQTKITKPLHQGASKSEFEPSFSTDGRYRAFVQSRGNLNLALVIRDMTANKNAEVKPTGGFCGFRSPCISPKNRRVIYSFAEKSRQQLYSVDMQAGNPKQLTDSVGVNNWPSFSADGKKIVFGSTRDGNYEIYSMNADGSDPKRLTHSRFQDIRPRISPDGKHIAFTSTRDGNSEIYVINVDGTNPVRVTNHDERDDYPAWHPDSKQLIFMREHAGRFNVYRVKLGN
jgi:TolB protein